MNLWGTTDIARFGNRLMAISPGDGSPVDTISDLRIESDNVLRVVRATGYGSPGEPITFARTSDGLVERIRRGMSAFPRALYEQKFLAGDEVRLP